MKNINLSHDELRFKYSNEIHLNGTPIGEDDFFVSYGHDISEDEFIHEVVRYFRAAEMFANDEADYVIFERELREQGVQRVWAKAFVEDDEDSRADWVISWREIDALDEYSFPLTVIALS